MRKFAYLIPLGIALVFGGVWFKWSLLRDAAPATVLPLTEPHPAGGQLSKPARSGTRDQELAEAPRAATVIAAAPGRAPASRKAELIGMLERIGRGGSTEPKGVAAILRAAVTELRAGDRAEVISQAGALVARSNLESGAGLLLELDDFRDRHGFVHSLLEAAMGVDPAKAADWVATLSESLLRNAAYTAMAMEWSRFDLPAALGWAQGLSDPTSRVHAFEGVTWTWAQQDPKAAYTWAAAITEAEVRNQVMIKIAKMIAVRDPQLALSWALQFPEGPGREQALNYAMFQWASRDLEAAASWTAGVKDAGLRSSSEVAIARSWSVEEAEGATNWAAGIPDPVGRTAALKTTLLKWAEVNPTAAAQWIGQSGISPINEDIFRTVSGGLATAQPKVREAWLKSIPHPEWRAVGQAIFASRPTVAPKR